MPEVTLTLPTLHPAQVDAHRKRMAAGRRFVMRCGRRWGKTDYLKTILCDGVAKGRNLGYFAPSYKIQAEAWAEISDILDPIKQSASQTKGVYRATTRGRLDTWSLENERAGRSRKYHGVVIDEAAFTKPNMFHVWKTDIEPTLLDYGGWAVVASTPNGLNKDNFFWRVCNEPEHGFTEFHAPTSTNPYMPAEGLALLKVENAPLVYQQEYLAEFVDWSGVQFFDLASVLVDGKAPPMPAHCDYVFATIDTAVKTGKAKDGTAVIYWARNKYAGHPLVAIDWDIVQIEGSLLEAWLPGVFRHLDHLAKLTGARMGSVGAHIEDKSTGQVLLQQAARKEWPAHPINSALTAVGKDERAISVSGYVYRGEVKIAAPAYDKLTVYKEKTRNHMVEQVFGFRLGDKDPTRQDDLLDCWTYSISIALGDSEGY